MPQFDPLKKPMSLDESERLLKGAADHDRVKSDWAFLGHSILGLGGIVLLVVAIISIVVGLF